MFVGRSREERALRREESSGVGWSFNPLQAVKAIFSSPAAANVAVATLIGPEAAAALTVARAVKGSGVIKTGPRAQPIAPPIAEADRAQGTAAPEKVSGYFVGYARRRPAAYVSQGTGYTMGAAPSMNDEEIAHLISREKDHDKRSRMVFSHGRARKLRNSGVGSAMSEVDEAIGELFARMPVDANSRPTLTPDQVTTLVRHLAAKRGPITRVSLGGARKLVASYVRMHGVATPGLKLRRAA
jgi:hypothetical protein